MGNVKLLLLMVLLFKDNLLMESSKEKVALIFHMVQKPKLKNSNLKIKKNNFD
jgi:hypothetical protein